MIDKEVRTHSKKESGIEKKGKGREDLRERRREESVEDVGQRAAHLPSCIVAAAAHSSAERREDWLTKGTM